MWPGLPHAVPGWLACLYCISFIGPLYHTFVGLRKTDDIRWFWHLPACLGSVLGTTWGYVTYRRRSRERNLIAALKPEQKLK